VERIVEKAIAVIIQSSSSSRGTFSVQAS